MNTETTQPNISATRGENPNVAQEGLDAEVRNHNNEVEKPALNSTGEINRLVDGTPPTESIRQYKDAVKKALERSYLEFLYAQSMGSWKSWAYADYLRKELSFTEDQARAIEAEVYEEFGKTADSGDWDIFLNGSPEQRKALQDAIAYEMYGEDPYHDSTDENSKNTVTHPNVAPDSSQQESELHETKISRALDKAGVKGPNGVNPEAIVHVLRAEGVDAEWRMSEDGKVGGIAIFRPGGRERSKSYIDFLYGKTPAGKEQP
jgi:hypothetical protein